MSRPVVKSFSAELALVFTSPDMHLSNVFLVLFKTKYCVCDWVGSMLMNIVTCVFVCRYELYCYVYIKATAASSAFLHALNALIHLQKKKIHSLLNHEMYSLLIFMEKLHTITILLIMPQNKDHHPSKLCLLLSDSYRLSYVATPNQTYQQTIPYKKEGHYISITIHPTLSFAF